MDEEQLKQVLTDHSLWLSSNGKQGKRAGLSGSNLTGVDLSWANLTGANLTEVNLTDVDLHWADLTGAELGPQIRECLTFEGAQVSEDQLSWLSLHPLFGEWRDSLTIVPASEPTT